VLRRVRLKPLLAFDRPVDLFRDHPLFRKTVRDHGRHRAMEEVQDPVMNASRAGAQLLDAVSQEVRFGTTQFVAHLAQTFQPEVALSCTFAGNLSNHSMNGHDPSSSR
jgi:hypothetical protein